MNLIQLTPRIYYLQYEHYADRPSLGYIKGDRRSLMFDAGGSPAHAEAFLQALREEGLPPPDFAALSHWHCDHSLGMCALDLPVIACASTNQKLTEMLDWRWDDASIRARIARRDETAFGFDMLHHEYEDCSAIRVRTADVVFEGELRIDLGGLSCRLLHVGGPHSPDSVVCCIPGEKVLFLGDSHGKDMLGLDWPYDPAHRERLHTTLAALPYDPEKRAAYCAALEPLEFDLCVGGHEDPMDRAALFSLLQAH